MRYVTYAEKAMLMDDDTADWILEYARALGTTGRTDTVKVTVIGRDGNEVEVTMLLNANTQLISESTHSSARPPRNSEAIGYMQEQTALILSPPQVQPEADWQSSSHDPPSYDA